MSKWYCLKGEIEVNFRDSRPGTVEQNEAANAKIRPNIVNLSIRIHCNFFGGDKNRGSHENDGSGNGTAISSTVSLTHLTLQG